MTGSFIISLIVLVLTIVAMIQIITKAGYSPWWILLPLSLPVLWIITWAVLFNDYSTPIVTGAFGGFTLFGLSSSGTVQTLVDLTEVDVLLNWLMFLVFAFSAWPAVQAARGRMPVSPPGGGRGGGFQPAVPGAPGPGGVAPSARQMPPAEGHAPGWYVSGPVGAGEQSYWDGAAWTARRKWQSNAWVDLPPPAPVEPEAQA